MVTKKAVYVKLEHPSGRTTTKKIMMKSKNLQGIQREYLGTAEHQRTEAYPVAIIKKPIKKKVVKRKKTSPYSFGGYKF